MPWDMVREIGLGVVIGFVFGWLLKKTIKVAVVLLVGFIALQVWLATDAATAAATLPDLSDLGKHAGSLLDQGRPALDKASSAVQELAAGLKVTPRAIGGFLAGLLVGLWKG